MFRFHFRLDSVSVLDSNEFDIFHFQVFPLEGDPPRGFPGVRVDGVFRSSFEFVVVKGGNEQEGFFIGLIENGKTFEGFDGIEGSELVDFFSAQFLAYEKFFGGGVCETPDHLEKIHRLANSSNGNSADRCIFQYCPSFTRSFEVMHNNQPGMHPPANPQSTD